MDYRLSSLQLTLTFFTVPNFANNLNEMNNSILKKNEIFFVGHPVTNEWHWRPLYLGTFLMLDIPTHETQLKPYLHTQSLGEKWHHSIHSGWNIEKISLKKSPCKEYPMNLYDMFICLLYSIINSWIGPKACFHFRV